MVNNLVRNAVESLYEGVCTITLKETVRDKGVTKTVDKLYCENQKCRLSYQSTSASDESETVSTSYQLIRLFIAPEIEIPEGAKITVTQDGRTDTYKRSSKPMVYSNHQEVLLERLEKN
jgi:hypothetical protein